MKDGLKHFSDTYLTLIGLVIFFGWFVLMLLYVLKLTPQRKHDKMAQIPLRNEEFVHE